MAHGMFTNPTSGEFYSPADFAEWKKLYHLGWREASLYQRNAGKGIPYRPIPREKFPWEPITSEPALPTVGGMPPIPGGGGGGGMPPIPMGQPYGQMRTPWQPFTQSPPSPSGNWQEWLGGRSSSWLAKLQRLYGGGMR